MKNMRQTKEQFKKSFLILKTNFMKIRDKLCTLLKIRDLLMISRASKNIFSFWLNYHYNLFSQILQKYSDLI